MGKTKCNLKENETLTEVLGKYKYLHDKSFPRYT